MKAKAWTPLLLCSFALAALFHYGFVEYWGESNFEERQNLREKSFSSDNEKRNADYVFKRRFPDALIIGAPKCGTRAVLAFIMLHPSVVAPTSELHFFDRPENFKKGQDAYLQQFPKSFPNQTVLEKTPAYLECKSCPGRIKNLNPSMKMIAILCDPVDRLRSQYMHFERHEIPIPPFQQWVLDEKTGRVKSESDFQGLRQGMYAKSLYHWLNFFPQKEIHVIDSQDFIDNPALVMTNLERFLGIPKFFKNEDFVYNDTKGFYCINGALRKQPCLSDDKGHKETIFVEPELVKKLEAFYYRHNKDLRDLLGFKMSWMRES